MTTQRICVLSTDNSPGYFYYVPFLEYYWNLFGWEIDLFVTPDVPLEDVMVRNPSTQIHIIPEIVGVRPNTLAQTVRHFASNVLSPEDYVMVQDLDLIPLREWNPDLNARTIWGYPELTGGNYIPVHYTGMLGSAWREVMDCTGDLKADMEREMRRNGSAYSDNGDVRWNTDWSILTEKVLAQKEKFTFIERGMENGLPKGRIDRSTIKVNPETFEYTWNTQVGEKIDCHCENSNSAAPQKWAMIRKLLVEVFGGVPDWADSYVETFYKKYGHG